MVDIDSVDFPTNNKPPLRRSESLLSMNSIRSQPKLAEPSQVDNGETKESEDDYLIPRFRPRKSFSAFVKSTNDFHVQLTIRSMSSIPSRRVYEFSKNHEERSQVNFWTYCVFILRFIFNFKKSINEKTDEEKNLEIDRKQSVAQVSVLEKKTHFNDELIEKNKKLDDSDNDSDDLCLNKVKILI